MSETLSPRAPVAQVCEPLDRGSNRGWSGAHGFRTYWWYALVVVVGSVLLRAAALKGTLLADDWDHYAIQRGIYPVRLPAWDMFRFVSDSAEQRQALLDAGRLPWWASSNLELAVFRPLSSLLAYVDLSWLDGVHHPIRMHAHSFVWWLVLISAVAALYKHVLPLPVAALALFIYAIDDAHVYPVAWVANRSELISVGLVTWGLWAHLAADQARQPWKLRAAAVGLVSLGLLAGEHAIAPLCYVLLFELTRQHASWKSRVQRLVPYGLVTCVYALSRAALGYGVAGSAFYIDPIGEPLRYMETAATRIPLLAGDLVLGVAPEWWYWGLPWGIDADTFHGVVPASWLTVSALQRVQVALGWLSLAGGLAGIVWLRRRARSSHVRRLWGWLLAAALSLIPLAGTASMSRLTVTPALAFDAAVAYVLWQLYKRIAADRAVATRIACGALMLVLCVVHIVRAIDFSLHETLFLTNTSHLEFGWTTKTDFGDGDVTKRHAMILSAHDMATQYCLPYILHAADLPAPLTTHLLSPAAENAHVLTRHAPNVLDIHFPEPIKNAPFAPGVYRQAGTGFYPGQTFHNAEFDVEVMTVRGLEPRHLRFTFKRPLDDPGYVFVYPNEDGLHAIELPPVGRSVRLPPPAWPQ